MNSWEFIYLIFVGSIMVLGLFSVDFHLSPSKVLRVTRLFGIRVASKVVVHRPELKALQRRSTPVWESKGIFSSTTLDGFVHEVDLVTLDNRCIPFIQFQHVHRNPPELIRTLAESSEVLQLPVNEQFAE